MPTFNPFAGSGSTLFAFCGHKNGIGIEIDRKYCELAKKRILVEEQINQLKLDTIAVAK